MMSADSYIDSPVFGSTRNGNCRLPPSSATFGRKRLPQSLLAFDEVRSQVENDYLVAQIQQAVDRRVAELEQRYEVILER